MKKSILSIALTVVFSGLALANKPVNDEKKEVKADESTVAWKAYKVTGSHTGTVDLKSGALMFSDGQLSGGEFEVDMTSLVSTDLEGGIQREIRRAFKVR